MSSDTKSSGFVYAIIIGLFVLIAGFAGLFKTSWNLGSFISKIPVWVWLVIAGLWLVNQMRK